MQVVDKAPENVVLGLSPGKQDRYTCICCRVKFDSVELQRSHFKTEWHLYNLKRKVCTLEPITLEAFNIIKAQQEANPDEDEQSEYGLPSYVELTREELDHSSGSESQTLDEEEWVKIDDDELDDFIDEDYAEDEIEEMLNKMVKPDTCLFCDKKSTSIQCNVSHMNSIHGFFIPEEQYLIDLDGLMDYLGFKVGAGATCLWCNKQFTSLHGVRLHMLYKDHCKILYDQEVAIGEFKEFYDYASQEQFEMKPPNELVVSSRAARRRHDSGCSKASPPSSKQRSKFIKQQLVVAQASGSALKLGEAYRTKRHIKRFNAERAKSLLNLGMIHNSAMRARMRQRNPI